MGCKNSPSNDGMPVQLAIPLHEKFNSLQLSEPTSMGFFFFFFFFLEKKKLSVYSLFGLLIFGAAKLYNMLIWLAFAIVLQPKLAIVFKSLHILWNRASLMLRNLAKVCLTMSLRRKNPITKKKKDRTCRAVPVETLNPVLSYYQFLIVTSQFSVIVGWKLGKESICFIVKYPNEYFNIFSPLFSLPIILN